MTDYEMFQNRLRAIGEIHDFVSAFLATVEGDVAAALGEVQDLTRLGSDYAFSAMIGSLKTGSKNEYFEKRLRFLETVLAKADSAASVQPPDWIQARFAPLIEEAAAIRKQLIQQSMAGAGDV